MQFCGYLNRNITTVVIELFDRLPSPYHPNRYNLVRLPAGKCSESLPSITVHEHDNTNFLKCANRIHMPRPGIIPLNPVLRSPVTMFTATTV